MDTQHVDLAIIGSGSGNSLITPFWDDKLVAIAERGVFGGTCLNVGCIPTKMFVRPSALARVPEEAARLGVTMRTESVDWPAIRDRVFGRIDPISAGGERYRAELDNVVLVSQNVRLDGPRAFVADDGTRIEADQLVIASGSRAVLPDIPGIDLPGVHTSDTVMRLDEFPARVLVVGGGYIACEFAGVFSGLGAEVVQLVRSDRMLRHLDRDVAEHFAAEAGKHWGVRLETDLESLEPREGGGLVATLSSRGDGSERLEADIVLVAIGRRPNSDLVGAAEAGIDLLDDGRIAVDEFQRVLSGGERGRAGGGAPGGGLGAACGQHRRVDDRGVVPGDDAARSRDLAYLGSQAARPHAVARRGRQRQRHRGAPAVPGRPRRAPGQHQPQQRCAAALHAGSERCGGAGGERQGRAALRQEPRQESQKRPCQD